MIKFDKFILESSKYDMRKDTYHFCSKNFRNIKTKMAGKIIKYIDKKLDNHKTTYKFISTDNIIIKKDNVDVETNEFELTENQISTLLYLKKVDLDNYLNGIRLNFHASEQFLKITKNTIIKSSPYVFYRFSYFDVVDENTISCLSYINDPNVPKNEKYTSNLRENIKIIDFYNIFYNENLSDYEKTWRVDNYKKQYFYYKRIQEGFDVPFYCTPSLSSLFQKIKFKIKYKTYDISYFDITDDDGTISFLPKNKIANIPKHELFNNKSRQI